MKTVRSEITVQVPVREVYEQWMRFEEYPTFMSGVEEVRRLDDKTLYWRVRVAGVERGFEAVVTERIRDERIAWKSMSGPEQSGVVGFLAMDEGRTRVVLELSWDPEGIVEKAGAAMKFDDAEVEADLKAFARRAEEQHARRDASARHAAVEPQAEGDPVTDFPDATEGPLR